MQLLYPGIGTKGSPFVSFIETELGERIRNGDQLQSNTHVHATPITLNLLQLTLSSPVVPYACMPSSSRCLALLLVSSAIFAFILLGRQSELGSWD